jgi:hypothetical protein
MIRQVLAIVVGLLVWMVGFATLAAGVIQVWASYGVHARQWMDQRVFTFPPAAASCNLILWILAAVAAGWATARIAGNRRTVWILAALMVLYLAALHLVLEWSLFPWWYNLGVVIPAVPAVYAGARLAGLFGPAAISPSNRSSVA